jgi:hypothetical protein
VAELTSDLADHKQRCSDAEEALAVRERELCAAVSKTSVAEAPGEVPLLAATFLTSTKGAPSASPSVATAAAAAAAAASASRLAVSAKIFAMASPSSSATVFFTGGVFEANEDLIPWAPGPIRSGSLGSKPAA